jgi:two-component sensor histidine kinase
MLAIAPTNTARLITLPVFIRISLIDDYHEDDLQSRYPPKAGDVSGLVFLKPLIMMQSMNCRIWLGILCFEIFCAVFSTLAAQEPVFLPKVETITADGKPVDISHPPVRISSITSKIGINFKPIQPTTSTSGHFYQTKLEGRDTDWTSWDCFMYAGVNFYDADGNQVKRFQYAVSGRSPGWHDNIEHSFFTRRREILTVPPKSVAMTVTISSAGPPKTMGVYLINGLEIWNESQLLMRPKVPRTINYAAIEKDPWEWIPDGARRAMSQIVKFRNNPVIAIIDDGIDSHSEWRTSRFGSPKITPGENLIIEWEELYNIGSGECFWSAYTSLHTGSYRLIVTTLDNMGSVAAPDCTMDIIIAPPLWQRPWFRYLSALLVIGGILLVMRQIFRAKVQRERLRITRDIHDDLGARLTHLYLICEKVRGRTTSPEAAQEHFEKVADIARNLVSTLHETIWTINPERDNLESLVSFLCQMVQSLCAAAGICCRLNVPVNIQPVPFSSETRHQICMIVKEAVNNAIKYSGTDEIILEIHHNDTEMNLVVTDRGKGFDLRSKCGKGCGLDNMGRRTESLGGSLEIHTAPGTGTRLAFRFPINGKNQSSAA